MGLRMAKIESLLLKSKFRGCMLGSLMGDCLGAPFEGDEYSAGAKLMIQRFFDQIEGNQELKVPYKPYTDDTAMTINVAKSLIAKPIDFTYMAKQFVVEYFQDPRRGYGGHIIDVFHKLRKDKFADVFKPASEQFGGSGSYGNGGAMRISPIALYFHDNYEAMINAAIKTTEITHTNKLGVHGAILQCIAVQQSLMTPPTEPINVQNFTDNLIEKMKVVEQDDEGLGLIETPYQNQLNLMKQILSVAPPEEPVSDEEIIVALGTDISALHSVPTAIYCFLKAQSDIPGIRTNNIFRRTIQYAITLGGDTDTIASMAGSIAGAYVGHESINRQLQETCELHDEIVQLADNLFDSIVNISK